MGKIQLTTGGNHLVEDVHSSEFSFGISKGLLPNTPDTTGGEPFRKTMIPVYHWATPVAEATSRRLLRCASQASQVIYNIQAIWRYHMHIYIYIDIDIDIDID